MEAITSRAQRILTFKPKSFWVSKLSVKDFLKALTKKTELEITVKGRRTQKTYSTPVWFVDQKNKIYLLPVKGSDTNWYKNIRINSNMTLTVDKRSLKVRAKPLDEPNQVKEVINLFGAKYGADVERWYTKLDVAVEIPLL
jgi:deazaflavin-dependent oxidoreductase (nitroreductase family)